MAPGCSSSKPAVDPMIGCALGQIFPLEKNLHESKMGGIRGFYIQKFNGAFFFFLSFASFLGSVYEAS